MEPETNQPFNVEPNQGQSKKIITIGVVVVVIILIALVVWSFFSSQINSNNAPATEADLQQAITEIKAQAANTEFQYQLVTNATERIELPPPPESTATDQQVYDNVKQRTPISADEVIQDHVYFLDFKGQPLGAYIDSLTNKDSIMQVNAELAHLTQYFNNQYPRELLKDRITGVTQYIEVEPVLEGSNNAPSVYPSIRAVVAYSAGEFMSRIDPQNRATYEADAQALVTRGIGYGLFGQSDADAAKSMVEQYFQLLDASESAL